MKPVILLTLVLFLLGGVLNATDTNPTDKKKEETGNAPRILQLPLMIIPVVTKGKIRRYYGIHMRIELKNSSKALAIQKRLPKLVDSIFSDFFKLFSLNEILKIYMTPVQARDQIQSICRRILGADAIHQVMIDSFTMHSYKKTV